MPGPTPNDPQPRGRQQGRDQRFYYVAMSTRYHLIAAAAATVVISGCGSAASDESLGATGSVTAAESTTKPSVTSVTTSSTTMGTNAPARAEPSTTTATPSPAPAVAPQGATVAAGSLGESPPTVVVATTEEANVAPSAKIEPALAGLVEQAIADLSTRLNVDSASISTVSARAVVWPDKSVGCPQAGMAYTQVAVDGALIELSVAGTTYRYHSGGARAPFLCTKA